MLFALQLKNRTDSKPLFLLFSFNLLAMALESTSPKTTAPPAASVRKKNSNKTTAEKLGKKLDAYPDKIDVRDWFYQPTLQPLPEQVINCMHVPCVLDQGEEGACTGFALAAVINFHLAANGRYTAAQVDEKEGVSPWMLYSMARRYDEWPGDDYEGSSARGCIKGWHAHGVVRKKTWAKDDKIKASHLTEKLATEALDVPAGAYYRVMHRQVRDMHAALHESGILYATLMVHAGWQDPKENLKKYSYDYRGNMHEIELPVIERQLNADGGHAIAIVGYTRDGFIIQNSWGDGWGSGGFALLPYEDWLLHGSDCWVVQLGVPIDINLWDNLDAKMRAGIQRASQAIPLQDIRPYVINVGNNGRLSDSGAYWTTEEDIQQLFITIDKTAAENKWRKRRIMLYLHGGLNSELEVARRIIAFKDVCLANEIYPVHIMWETDFWNSLKNNLFDIFTNDDKATINWMKLREGAMEIKDRGFEITSAKIGTMLWDEMKENAQLASSPNLDSNGKKRAMKIVADKGRAAYNRLPDAQKKSWEIHVVGHSAGSIYSAYALQTLAGIGIPIKSLQYMAPAISIDLFKKTLLQQISNGELPPPTLYVLSDRGERDDDVGPYGKSLLYLVSNAFERKRGTPILGMEKFINGDNSSLDPDLVDKDIAAMLKKKIAGREPLVIAGKAKATQKHGDDICRCETHGGFDNDPFTLNSVLFRILGYQPEREFTERDLQW